MYQRIGVFDDRSKLLYVVDLFISWTSWKSLQNLVPQRIEMNKGIENVVVHGKKVWQLQDIKTSANLVRQRIDGFDSSEKVLYVTQNRMISWYENKSTSLPKILGGFFALLRFFCVFNK